MTDCNPFIVTVANQTRPGRKFCTKNVCTPENGSQKTTL